MKPILSDHPYLTLNERAMLRMLLSNGRMSDVEAAQKLKISPQASNKIRRKLEKSGLIENYTIDVDYLPLGINIFCIASLEISSGKLEESILNSQYGRNVIGFYRVIKNHISHFLVAGFPNLSELDRYFHSLHSKYEDSIRIKKISIFPVDRLIKHSSKDFFSDVLKDFGKGKDPTALQILNSEKEQKIRNNIKLNSNEKAVLEELSSNGRASHRRIVIKHQDRKLTSRAVSNIRERLEKKGVIKGYSCSLNYKDFGVNLLAMLFLKKKPHHSKIENGFHKWANESKHVLGCYHLNEESLHVTVCAFKNIKELENYSKDVHKINGHLFDIEQIYVIPQDGILKNSPRDLINVALTGLNFQVAKNE